MKAFRAAMHAIGLNYGGPIIADGKLHRFKADGDGEKNSWYVLHSDPPVAGAFGCWKRAMKETWCERNGQLSQREWDQVRRRWQDSEGECERTEAERHAKARKIAGRILTWSKPADGSHSYLVRKGVGPHGELTQRGDLLVVPLRDIAGELLSLQFIAPDKRFGDDGEKRDKTFLVGGEVSGTFFTVSNKPDGALLIAEGYATAATVHQATGFATVAAMNCGNLFAVAKAQREKFPDREIIIAADNDQATAGNPGLSKAREAALSIGARLAVPKFADVRTKPTDFNDLAALEGLAAVKAQIDAAQTHKETDADTFARLAKLSRVEYDRCREAQACLLNIRASTLDAEIASRRERGPRAAGRALQGCEVGLADVEPWPDPVDGADVLDQVASAFARRIVLPPGAADASALWTTGSHAYDAWLIFPRLNLTSPEKGCGKTTMLDVIAVLTARPLLTENITTAALFRLVEKLKPTLLLDEVDGSLHDDDELRRLLNAGHKLGGLALRCEGENNEVRGFRVYAPAVLAGIGALPGTLHDRSIVIRFFHAKPREIVARFDARHVEHEMELCRKLARWCTDNRARLEACDPAMPPGAFNRLADNWRPLFAVAEVAGGDWPRRVAAAFAALTSQDDMDAQGVGTMLLVDIAAVFAAADVDKLPSTKLAAALAQIEGRPWAEWGRKRVGISVNQLANQLRKFDIAPHTIRIGDETAKGYALPDFDEAFERYLPETPFPDRHTVTTPENIAEFQLSETSHAATVLRSENAVSPSEIKGCYAVTVQKPRPTDKEADLL